MDEIRRIQVLLLGQGDFPLHPPIHVTDPEALTALRELVEQEASAGPRLTHPEPAVVRATVRTGIATLVRTLKARPTKITDDGRLEPIKETVP